MSENQIFESYFIAFSFCPLPNGHQETFWNGYCYCCCCCSIHAHYPFASTRVKYISPSYKRSKWRPKINEKKVENGKELLKRTLYDWRTHGKAQHSTGCSDTNNSSTNRLPKFNSGLIDHNRLAAAACLPVCPVLSTQSNSVGGGGCVIDSGVLRLFSFFFFFSFISFSFACFWFGYHFDYCCCCC